MVNTQEDLLLFEMNLDICHVAPTSGLSRKHSAFLLEPPGRKITKTVCALKACSIPGPSELTSSCYSESGRAQMGPKDKKAEGDNQEGRQR